MNGFRRRLLISINEESSEPDYSVLDTYGVAIMDVRGRFYKDAASWQYAGSPDVNGVAVSDGTHRFCIAKDIVSNVCNSDYHGLDAEYWGAYQKNVSGVATITDSTVAITDFNGVGNTDAIVENVIRTDGYFTKYPWSAAGLCKQFIFPNGATGYLGACGEWYLVNNVRSTVNSLLEAIGGTKLQFTNVLADYGYYWTSTQYNAANVWAWNFTQNKCGAYGKQSQTFRVRAFCEIGNKE